MRQNTLPKTEGIHVAALVKGHERYVFLFDEPHRTAVLRKLALFACDPELSFNWHDAAALAARIKA